MDKLIAAKVGAEVLAGALASLPPGPTADQVIGLDARDDAAVLRPPPGKLLVQSVDHFRAFIDDPYVFGQIAAAHALSDLHAMGAQPWTALAVASVPYAPSSKMRTDLSAMLLGATEVLNADGCALVGGHSGEAPEAALGFAVTGLVEPDRRVGRRGQGKGRIVRAVVDDVRVVIDIVRLSGRVAIRSDAATKHPTIQGAAIFAAAHT
jgi:selenide,water dikinase